MIGRSVRTPKQVILRGDDAVDWSKSDWDKYVESGFDSQHLALVPGQKPTTFTIGQLTRPQQIVLDSRGTGALASDFLIMCGLHAIDEYVIVKPDGSRHIITGPSDREKTGNLDMTLTTKYMDDLCLPPSQRDCLAECIRSNSEVPLPLSKPAVGASGA